MVFKDFYIKMRDNVLLVKDAPKIYTAVPSSISEQPFSEKILRAIWFEQKFEKRNLKVLSSEKLRVINPGEWNPDTGPDFSGAEFIIGEQKFKADVEIHKFASDWKRHGHHNDKNFSGVKLHVFLVNDTKRKENGIFQLCLGEYIAGPFDLNLDDYPYQSFAGRGFCGDNINPSDFEHIENFLNDAGDGRIILKSKMLSDDSDEEIYSGFLKSLGYKENKKQMEKLASLVTFKKIKTVVGSLNNIERATHIQAIFYGAGGFLEGDFSDDEETAHIVQNYKQIFRGYKKYCGEIMKIGEWCFRRIRPPNFPQRRLYGASFIIDAAVRIGFLNLAVSWVKTLSVLTSGKNAPKDIIKLIGDLFAVEPKGYFASRAKFGHKWNSPPSSLIGPQRALSAVVNAVIPVLYKWTKSNDACLEKIIHSFYCELPALEPNRTTRKMGCYLFGGYFGRNFRIKKERQAQGLIQIFQDFCGDKRQGCKTCLLPDTIKRFSDEL